MYQHANDTSVRLTYKSKVLAGFVPTENLWFRDEYLTFAETPRESAEEIYT